MVMEMVIGEIRRADKLANLPISNLIILIILFLLLFTLIILILMPNLIMFMMLFIMLMIIILVIMLFIMPMIMLISIDFIISKLRLHYLHYNQKL